MHRAAILAMSTLFYRGKLVPKKEGAHRSSILYRRLPKKEGAHRRSILYRRLPKKEGAHRSSILYWRLPKKEGPHGSSILYRRLTKKKKGRIGAACTSESCTRIRMTTCEWSLHCNPLGCSYSYPPSLVWCGHRQLRMLCQ